jgi:hypothetical protein
MSVVDTTKVVSSWPCVAFHSKLEVLRASPVIPGSAFASGIEKWPPSRMQMQTHTQAMESLILHHLNYPIEPQPKLDYL